MIRRLLLTVAIAMGAGNVVTAAAERPVLQPTPWVSIAQNPKFRLEGQGDLQSEQGATLVVESSGAGAGESGGAIAGVDARALQGRRVMLSATLSATAGARNVAVWMRADGADKRKLGFINSAQYPVSGGQPPVQRQVSLLIPAEAEHVVFGLAFVGSGRVEAHELRLRVSDEPLVDADATPRAVLDAAIAATQEHALHGDKVDWDAMSAKLRADSAAAKSTADVYPQIRALLAALNDGHSRFLTPDAALQHASTGAASQPPEVRLLDHGIGYVLMPGFSGRDEKAEREFRHAIADDIARHAAKAGTGWIVDLRENSGGNMWPMLAALKALLGDGVIGQFRNGDGETHPWRAGDHIDDKDSTGPADLSGVRVAVLIGERTASSGEAVAVAFHGRPQTRSFGQATAGQANANSSYRLPDGSQLFLTTAIDLDRNGVAFGHRVEPDQAVAADGDAALAAAIAWLARSDKATSP